MSRSLRFDQLSVPEQHVECHMCRLSTDLDLGLRVICTLENPGQSTLSNPSTLYQGLGKVVFMR